MELHSLKKLKSWDRSNKRVGRGGGSGKGWHTTGKGNKGQKVRAGRTLPVGFEGGQVPLYKKLPHIGGFKNTSAKKVWGIKVSDLSVLAEGTEVTKKVLIGAGLVNKSFKGLIKILDGGKLDTKLIFKGLSVSNSAKQKLEKSGSTFVNA